MMDVSQSLLDGLNDSLLSVDRGWRIRVINQNAAHLSGLEPSDLVGKDLWSVFPRLVGSSLEKRYREAMENRQATHFVSRGVINAAWHSIHIYPSGDGILILGIEDSARKEIEIEMARLLGENQQQKELLEAIFDADPGGIAVVQSRELRFSYANPAYRYICPQTGLELIGQRYEDIWSGKTPFELLGALRAVVDTGRPYQALNFERRYEDGSRRVFTLQARRIAWNEQPAAMLALWDTTELRLTEERLRESEEKFRTIANFTHDWEYWLGPNNELLYISPSCEQIAGRPPQDFLDRPELIEEIVHPEDRPLFRHHSQEAHDSHVDYALEFRIITPSGGERWIEHRCHPVTSADGHPLGRRISNREITERKRSELALRQEEATLRSILNATQESIWLFNPDGTIRMANGTALARLKRPADEVIGRYFRELLPAELADARINRLQQVFDSGQPVEFEDQRAGIYFLHSFYPEVNPDGRITGVVSFSRDITERRQAEEALSSSERTLQLFVQYAPAAIAMFDRDMRYIAASQRYLSDYRLEKQDLIGRFHYEVFPDIPEHWKEIHRRCLAGAVEACADDPFPREDGTVDAVQWEIHPWYDDAGEIGGIILFSEVITARKQAQEQIAAEKEWFRTTLASIGDAVITTDRDGHITYLNPIAEQLTGWPNDEGVGQPMVSVLDVIDERTHQHISSPVEKVLLEGNKVALANHSALVARDGRLIPIEDSAAPIRDSAGQTIGVVMVFHDVEQKRRTEEKLQQFNRLIELSYEPIFSWELGGPILTWNRGCEQLYGYTREEAVGQVSHALLHTRYPVSFETLQAELHTTGTWTGEIRHRTKDGREVVIESRHQLIHSAGKWQVLETNRDVTLRKQAETNEQELNRLNRTLKALARSSQALLHFEDEQEYLNEVCRIVTEDCGHAMVWVGYAENDELKSVRPVVHSGFEEGYLETLQITWADTERGRGPTGTAIRTGKVSMCRNMLTDPAFLPWREEALKRGYASSIVLPLVQGGRGFGALTIYSRQPDPFSDDEIQLLTELANDLAYGIITFRTRQAQSKAEKALKENEQNRARIEVQRLLIEQREQERLQIARDLHDGPLQEITAASFALQSMLIDCQRQSPDQATGFETIRTSLQAAASELRGYAQELRPPVLTRFGLEKAIKAHLVTFKEKHPGIAVDFTAIQDGDLLTEPIRVALYRIYQEALNNILKHAHATRVAVQMAKTSQEVILTIQDNGEGFDFTGDWLDFARQGHLGLVGMQERAEAIGGQLELTSSNSEGTRVLVRVPMMDTLYS
jgi:PAS domain S-box-containing protein